MPKLAVFELCHRFDIYIYNISIIYMYMCVYLYIYMCVCVSTPVSKDTTLTLSNLPYDFCDQCTAAGGARDHASLALTKTLALVCEIDLGRQIDVPANCLNHFLCTLVQQYCSTDSALLSVESSQGLSIHLKG